MLWNLTRKPIVICCFAMFEYLLDVSMLFLVYFGAFDDILKAASMAPLRNLLVYDFALHFYSGGLQNGLKLMQTIITKPNICPCWRCINTFHRWKPTEISNQGEVSHIKQISQRPIKRLVSLRHALTSRDDQTTKWFCSITKHLCVANWNTDVQNIRHHHQ